MARRRTPFAITGPRLRPTLLSSLALLFLVPPAAGQVGRVRVEENFRSEPNGTVLARLMPGAPLAVEGRQGGWLEVVLEGWVWIRSLQNTDRGGYDLVVSAPEGENLRSGPRGAVLAHLESSTLLEEIERIPGWIRTRRRGWVWTESVYVTDAEPGEGPSGAGETPVEEGREEEAASGAAAAGAIRPTVLTAPRAGLPMLAAPGGDTLGRARAGADVEVTARQGGWARVRLEGWAWLPDVGVASEGDTAGTGPAVDVSPEDVRREPGRFVGRVVSWDLQYVSLERAERVRTDFFEGEPFLLTRISGEEGSFVYVAVPSERMELVDGLTPLERLRVTGRIRSGASALTGSPILDLVALERRGR